MARHFQTLLEGDRGGAGAAVSDAAAADAAEREQLLVEWNETDSEYPRSECVHELFEEQVSAHAGGGGAGVSARTQLTYGELNERANSWRTTCGGWAWARKCWWGICLERSMEMVVGLLGILKAGGAYVPLDPAVSARAAGVHARGRAGAGAADAGSSCAAGCRRRGAHGGLPGQ